MEKVTVEQILKRYGLREGDLAVQIGVSISLISRIKTDFYPVTSDTQYKFQKVYKGCELVNGYIKWKELYLEQVRINEELKQEIKDLKSRLKKIARSREKLSQLLED